MKTHNLKTDPDVFRAVQSGRKTFEIRKDDRGFQLGDYLVLLETKYDGMLMNSDPHNYPLLYTGAACVRRVTHILHGPIYGLQEGWVIMSVA